MRFVCVEYIYVYIYYTSTQHRSASIKNNALVHKNTCLVYGSGTGGGVCGRLIYLRFVYIKLLQI